MDVSIYLHEHARNAIRRSTYSDSGLERDLHEHLASQEGVLGISFTVTMVGVPPDLDAGDGFDRFVTWTND